MDIGEKIKILRKSKNKSQEALAFDIGVSRQTINKWETNKAQPNTENIVLLCSIFEVSADYFLESLSVDNEGKDIAVPVATTKNNVKLKVLIICSVLCGLFLLICGLFTIAFGSVVFSTNKGAEVIGTDSVGISEFIIVLVLTILSLVTEALLLMFIFKIQKKTTKGDMNVN